MKACSRASNSEVGAARVERAACRRRRAAARGRGRGPTRWGSPACPPGRTCRWTVWRRGRTGPRAPTVATVESSRPIESDRFGNDARKRWRASRMAASGSSGSSRAGTSFGSCGVMPCTIGTKDLRLERSDVSDASRRARAGPIGAQYRPSSAASALSARLSRHAARASRPLPAPAAAPEPRVPDRSPSFRRRATSE